MLAPNVRQKFWVRTVTYVREFTNSVRWYLRIEAHYHVWYDKGANCWVYKACGTLFQLTKRFNIGPSSVVQTEHDIIFCVQLRKDLLKACFAKQCLSVRVSRMQFPQLCRYSLEYCTYPHEMFLNSLALVHILWFFSLNCMSTCLMWWLATTSGYRKCNYVVHYWRKHTRL